MLTVEIVSDSKPFTVVNQTCRTHLLKLADEAELWWRQTDAISGRCRDWRLKTGLAPMTVPWQRRAANRSGPYARHCDDVTYGVSAESESALSSIYRVGLKTAHGFHCNNHVYSQAIFIILAHIHYRNLQNLTVSPPNTVCVTTLPCKILTTTIDSSYYQSNRLTVWYKWTWVKWSSRFYKVVQLHKPC